MSGDDVEAVIGDLDRQLAHELQNDLGNGRRLIARFGNDILHVPEIGWHVWDGKRFNLKNGEAAARRLAHDTSEAIFDEADALPKFAEAKPEGDDDHPNVVKWADRKQRFEAKKRGLRRWALSSGNEARINAMLKSAQPYLVMSEDELDSDPFRLNCQNGTLTLAVGKDFRFAEFDRADRITQICRCGFEPGAIAPKWESFVADILPDEEVRGFVQRWLGYCLTGDNSEQVMVYFEGAGANGKSTLLETVSHVIGDYAETVPIETFLYNGKGRGSEASPDVARLPRKRLVRTGEAEPGARLSEGLIKTATGGDRMTARRLYRDMFDFNATFKLTFSVNVRPIIRGKDHGIRRRIKVVPFTRIFEKEKDSGRRRKLTDELIAEAPGILNWLLDGFEQWYVDGLAVPAAVEIATEEYFIEQDPIGNCLKEICERIDTERVPARRLYAAYQRWCRAYGEDVRSQTAFGRRLTDMRIHKEKIGQVYYVGLRIREEWQQDEPTELEQIEV